MLRFCLGLLLAMIGVTAVEACRISNWRPPTFREEAKLAMARVILIGTIANPRQAGPDGDGKTDFLIEETLRDDPIMKGKKSLVLPRYVPTEKRDRPPRFVLFCDVTKGKEDPYRGVLLHRAASVEYIKKGMALDPNDPVKNLVFFFDHLDDPDPVVAEDAFLEFSSAKDTDIQAAGRKLDASKIRKWLEDPKTPQTPRVGLYAKLLAASGTPRDAVILAAILGGPGRESGSGLDMILVGYVMLAPKDGWAYTRAILGNPREDFYRRYAALRAVRYLVDSGTGVVSNRQTTAVYRLLLGQQDFHDIAIEDLRIWKRWDMADAVFAIVKTEAHEFPVVKWSMLRYALQCKGNAAATAYIAARRKADPEVVADEQKILDREAAIAKKSAELPKK